MSEMAEEWKQKLENTNQRRKDTDRLVMNYLLAGGKETIEAFARESGIKLSTEQLEHVSKRAQIRDAIHVGKIPQAIALIDQMYPDLLKSDSHLSFLLQQQHLIELIRQSNDEEALAFAQKHVAGKVEHNAAMREELERTLTLLIGEKSPHSHLLNVSHRKALATKVNTAILKSEHGESSTPRLAQLLKIFLWAQDQLDQKKAQYPALEDLGILAPEDSK